MPRVRDRRARRRARRRLLRRRHVRRQPPGLPGPADRRDRDAGESLHVDRAPSRRRRHARVDRSDVDPDHAGARHLGGRLGRRGTQPDRERRDRRPRAPDVELRLLHRRRRSAVRGRSTGRPAGSGRRRSCSRSAPCSRRSRPRSSRSAPRRRRTCCRSTSARWRNGGFDLLPEAYFNQYPGDRPDLTVAHAVRAGWPLSLVHPGDRRLSPVSRRPSTCRCCRTSALAASRCSSATR